MVIVVLLSLVAWGLIVGLVWFLWWFFAPLVGS